MGKGSKFVEIGFICAAAAISFSLLINLLLVACGIVPYNKANLGNSEVYVPYQGGFLPVYQNFFEKGRVAVTNVAARQFPGYVKLLETDGSLDRLLNRGLYGLSFGKNYSFLPASASDNETLFIQKDGEYLVRILKYQNSERLISDTADLVNAAAERNPGLAFGFYIVPSPYDTGLLSDYEPSLGEVPDYVDLALSLLSPGIAGGWLEYDDMDGYLEYFYKSDHHWNYTGAYQGYRDILDLMRPADPSLGGPLPAGERRVLDPEFRGSLSRRTATGSVFDELYDFSVELPPYTARFMDVDMSVRLYDTAFPDREAFLSGESERYKYLNTYALLFRNDYPMVDYDFGIRSGRNLLLLGDSATNCMEILLAGHYDRTYSVDLRHYKSFKLDGFIEENGITDVVFLYTSPGLCTIGSSFRGALGG